MRGYEEGGEGGSREQGRDVAIIVIIRNGLASRGEDVAEMFL